MTRLELQNPENRRKYFREWYKLHREEKHQYAKDYARTHPTEKSLWAWTTTLWKRYKMTADQYDTLFVAQGGRCAICKEKAENFDRRLAVDHNHTTGKVRGLLCLFCNNQIVRVVENFSPLLKEAEFYLDKYKGDK
jgi:hypothetical protein